MFFGLPGQLYFARDPTREEATQQGNLKREIGNNPFVAIRAALDDPSSNFSRVLQTSRNTQTSIGVGENRDNPTSVRDQNEAGNLAMELLRAGGETGGETEIINKLLELSKTGNTLAKDLVTETTKSFIEKQEMNLAQNAKIIKPFRAYHLLTSENHIIWNNITASSIDSYNTVSVQWAGFEFDDKTGRFIPDGEFNIDTIKVDGALPDESIKEKLVQFNNCYNPQLARRYGLSMLQDSLANIYKGQIVIIGNPDIKPHDICFVADSYNDMVGPIVVEQVVHTFSQETGFITEITPDLFVTVNEMASLTMADAMAMYIEDSSTARYTNRPGNAKQWRSGLDVLLADISLGIGEFALWLGTLSLAGDLGSGSFMRRHVIPITNYMQPVMIHPLMHRGKPLIAGLPTDKIQSTWATMFGKWLKEGSEGWELWKEDLRDKLTLARGSGSWYENAMGPKF